MDIKTYKEALPYLFKANITPMVWGFHGVGKSEVHNQIAEKLGYKIFNLRLGQMSDAGDLLGLGDLRKDPKTGETISTKFFVPNWLREAVDYCEKNPKSGYIIFLDEINRAARKDILQASFQLVLDKRLHEVILPENCHVVAGGNPDTEDYSVLTFDDKAFISRFCHLAFKPTKREWISYTKDQEHDETWLNFLMENESCIEVDLQEFDLNKVIKPCRRSCTAVDKLIRLNPPTHVLRTLMQGLVGLEPTVAYFKFLENQVKPLTSDQIIKEYPKYQEMIRKLSKVEACRGDIINVCCTNLEDFFEKSSATKLTQTEQKNVLSFIKDLPKDQVISTLRKISLADNINKALEKDMELLEMLAALKGTTIEKLDEEEKALQNSVTSIDK